MFSTAQQEYIDSFVPTMLAKGYNSYIVYTHTNIQSGYYVLAEPDLIFIFSTKKITANSSYQYRLDSESESVKYEVRTANYSSSTNAVNTERIEGTTASGSINVPIYEHIYTNAEFSSLSIQPDIMKGGENNDALQTETGNILLCAFFLVFCFFKMWKIGR